MIFIPDCGIIELSGVALRAVGNGAWCRSQKGGVCITHGAKKKKCSIDECPNLAIKGGVCVTQHDAKKRKRKESSHDECTTHGGGEEASPALNDIINPGGEVNTCHLSE